ncbi:MAG TPA: branched-chain amino acid ABC transporter substrate-binding protein [Desulfomonilia bacterium]
MKKSVLAIIITALFALPVFGADTIRIGVAGPHSGDLASYGIPSANAVEIVVDDINAKGGINGRKIEIIKMDDVCKPEQATNVAQKLVSEKVVAVVGHICSGATRTALSTYRDAKIITISPSATKTDLTTSMAYPNFYRTIGSDQLQAELMADFAVNKLKLKTFAVIHDKGDYGKDVAEFARAYLEKHGGRVKLFEGITPGAVDYSAIIQRINREKVDVVIYGGYHPEGSKIVSGMRKKGMKTIFISDDGLKDDTFIKVAGRYAEGVYATGPTDTTKLKLAQEAIAKHKSRFGSDPGAFYLNAYSAIMALTNAISKAGSTDYDAVGKALKTQWVETPLGKISFDAKGDAKGIGFSVFVVKNGRYAQVK